MSKEEIEQAYDRLRPDPANRHFSPQPGPGTQQLKFSEKDSQNAAVAWNATCGPHSLAAALNKNLEDIKQTLTNYKGWMSPSMIEATLQANKVAYKTTKRLKIKELCNGINRIQWEGPWLTPGKPPKLAYFHTHWVAHHNGWVLCTALWPCAWTTIQWWRAFHQTYSLPFHITDHYQFE